MKRIVLCTMAILVGCVGDVGQARSALIDCDEVALNVDVGTTPYTVVGDLCYDTTDNNQTVLLMLSGGTYGRIYWNWPDEPGTYSFVERALDAGYATFNLDRIGVGESSRPPSDEVTLQSNIQVIQQVVDALGDEIVDNVSFPRIAIVCHSLSGPMGLSFAGSTSSGVDAVVATSWLHLPGPGFPIGPATSSPATTDPRFAGQNIPLGYLTTDPGTRGQFYYLPNAELDVVLRDEVTKETITDREALSFVMAEGGGAVVPDALVVPALIVVGENDPTFCVPGACVEADEEPNAYTSGAPDMMIVPDTGHDVTLHRNAMSVQNDVLDWLDDNLGP